MGVIMVLALTADEREQITVGVELGLSNAQIARGLGRHRATVGRELARNAVRPVNPNRDGADRVGRYSGVYAQTFAAARRARPRPGRLAVPGQLRSQVLTGLAEGWSPAQISGDLRRRFPHNPQMHVSHETIYQAVYLQARGGLRELLREQQALETALRTGRVHRRSQSRAAQAAHRAATGKPWVELRISDRPADAADRAVPGHWEGDLLIGARGTSAVATLVERSTRFLILVALPQGKVSEHVTSQLSAAMSRLPEHLLRSLTWDQGSEMSTHTAFTIATGCPVYFCDPHSPWQRGSNENTNGLLRQYLPRRTNLTSHTQTDLNTIADRLNTRPRRTHGWHTPTQQLTELLVATTA